MNDEDFFIDNFDEEIETKKEEDSVLLECSQNHIINKSCCGNENCKHWIDFKEDNNCDLISIEKNGPLTLRQVGERMGVSYVRIKQIEDSAIKKIRQTIPLEKLKY